MRGVAMPRDSNESELDALQRVGERLGGFDPRLSGEWLDGALTALMAGPSVPPSPTEAVEALCGDAWMRTFADPADVEAAQAALAARWRVLRRQLDPEALDDAPDALHLAPLLLTPGAGLPLGADWAAGFLTLVGHPRYGWRAAAAETGAGTDEDLASLLSPIERLVPTEAVAVEASPEDASGGDARESAVDEATFAAQDLRRWWSANAPRTAPRHVAATPGRNDPCPCGSGRKFKKCHGAV
jgi:uncharacterized protein